ncbi:MAG: 23S rRNA pseudouridine synthase F [Candidatus Nealsonbacteria bacterium]|nr:23S rRNA pseudouridine synthase F [Candidatus Nealsonbacteria bacterium]
MDYPIRINKYLRDLGIASRREVDELVEGSFVLVNGEIVKNGFMVNEGDKVTVKDRQKNYQYFAYYKPRGLSTQDLPGIRSVITEFKDRGMYPVGRLDKESEGLVFITNDGRFTREVLSRKDEYEKEYIVTVREDLRPSILPIIRSGMKVRGLGQLLPVKAEIIDKVTMRMILKEGKRHQIRVMLNDFSYTIVSLKRVRIGNIELGDLQPGEVRPIDVKL